MNRNLLFTVAIAGVALGACDSGDINIAPSTSVSNSNNTTNNAPSGPGFTDADCASINVGGNTVQGSADAATGNCTYPDIVGAGNNLQHRPVHSGARQRRRTHLRRQPVRWRHLQHDACLAANGITQGGDGPTLTIEAGATLAFRTSSDFLVINRGSRIWLAVAPMRRSPSRPYPTSTVRLDRKRSSSGAAWSSTASASPTTATTPARAARLASPLTANATWTPKVLPVWTRTSTAATTTTTTPASCRTLSSSTLAQRSVTATS